MAYSKRDSKVQEINGLFGGANFADILNRLWMLGKDPKELQRALAQHSVGTNDPTDIITRVLNMGLATEEELRRAPTLPVPEGVQWAFGPENVQDGVVKPWHTNAFAQPGQPGGPPAGPGPAPTPINIPASPALAPPGTGPGGRAPRIQNITSPTKEKPKKKPTTPEEIAAYQREHFSTMLWINDVPELKQKLVEAAKGEWTPERFKGEIESTNWWKSHDEDHRKWVALKSDPETYKDRINDKRGIVGTIASTWGFGLSDEQMNQLADDSIRLNWDENMLRKQVVNQVKYDPNQGGALGQMMGTVKGQGKGYLIKMTDEDAFNFARQIAAGEITEETFQGNMRTQAKSSYPGLAELIDQGVIPRDAVTNQVNTVASLMGIGAEQVDLTDTKWNGIVSHADTNGKLRPMTVDETAKFVKQKDEYWNTSNANTEVSSLLAGIGQMFGKSAV